VKTQFAAEFWLLLILFAVLVVGCALRVHGTGKAQVDNLEFSVQQSKVTTAVR
jgi:hypothetical protein